MSDAITIVADENLRGKSRYLKPLGQVLTASGRDIDAEMVEDADALLVRSVTQVSEALLAKAKKLRFVGSATAGLDHVDQEVLKNRGIAFYAAPGSNANSVVEYVLAAIAAHSDTLERLLAGARVGVVGQGYVGRLLLHRLQALGISCCCYDPWLELDAKVTLEEVLACEVVSLHPSLHQRTPWPSYHLLNNASLAQLRQDVLLINASRGAVVDNKALAAWLSLHPDAKVVLDVWEHEPTPDLTLVRQASIATPHIAGYAYDAKLQATEHLARKLCGAFALQAEDEEMTGDDAQLHALTLHTASTPEMLRSLLSARYDIWQDHQRFISMCERAGNSAELADGFDTLRKTYPERRELAGSTVLVKCDAGYALAKALGVVVAR